MRKIFVKFVCFFIGSTGLWFHSVVEGQVISPASGNFRIEENYAFPDIQLRFNIADTEAFKGGEFESADSTVTYTKEGNPVRKYVFKDNMIDEYTWRNGEWMFVNKSYISGRTFVYPPCFIDSLVELCFSYPAGRISRSLIWFPGEDIDGVKKSLNPKYNAKGNLISFFLFVGNSDYWMEITYQTFNVGTENEFELPILIQGYFQGRPSGDKLIYQYDSKGNLILYEEYSWDGLQQLFRCKNNSDTGYGKEVNQYNANNQIITSISYRADQTNNIWVERDKKEFKHDEKSIETGVYEYVWSNNTWELNEYTIYYFPDNVSNGKIEIIAPVVYFRQNIMYVQSEQPETISVYSINGSKIYEIPVQAGTTSINAANFPQGIVIVKGSSGWVTKVINNI